MTYDASVCSVKTHLAVHYGRLIANQCGMFFYATWRPESKNFFIKKLILSKTNLHETWWWGAQKAEIMNSLKALVEPEIISKDIIINNELLLLITEQYKNMHNDNTIEISDITNNGKQINKICTTWGTLEKGIVVEYDTYSGNECVAGYLQIQQIIKHKYLETEQLYIVGYTYANATIHVKTEFYICTETENTAAIPVESIVRNVFLYPYNVPQKTFVIINF
eukprot:Phypoly_transcript_18176.p1 GENE.Phypoly_transcript_18176~~Phypoly_transcript_18176.p1  ORF type:complete len:247 (+),score=7.21 Phypoly_transcript_18176:76-741(+)